MAALVALAVEVGVVCFGPTVQTIIPPTPKGRLGRRVRRVSHVRRRTKRNF